MGNSIGIGIGIGVRLGTNSTPSGYETFITADDELLRDSSGEIIYVLKEE